MLTNHEMIIKIKDMLIEVIQKQIVILNSDNINIKEYDKLEIECKVLERVLKEIEA